MKAFHYHCDSLPTANARSREPVFLFSSPEFIKKGDHKARTSCAEGMSQRDRASVHVYFLAIQS